MSKKKWLLLIIVLTAFSYLILSKVYPAIGTGIDAAVGPTISGAVGGITSMITSSPTWQAYDIYFAMVFGGLVVGLFMWQSHNAYNYIRQSAARSAVKEAYGGPVIATQPSAQTPITATTRPTVTPTVQPTVPQPEVPTEPPKEQPKQ